MHGQCVNGRDRPGGELVPPLPRLRRTSWLRLEPMPGVPPPTRRPARPARRSARRPDRLPDHSTTPRRPATAPRGSAPTWRRQGHSASVDPGDQRAGACVGALVGGRRCMCSEASRCQRSASAVTARDVSVAASASAARKRAPTGPKRAAPGNEDKADATAARSAACAELAAPKVRIASVSANMRLGRPRRRFGSTRVGACCVLKVGLD